MQLEPHLDALLADLAALAAVGDEATARAAEQLTRALRSSATLRLLDLLGDAALEVSAQLPSGHVEVRLAGQEPALVYVEDAGEAAAPAADDAVAARITLRLPEALKAAVEAAAAREGLSVNTWLVRALSRAVSSPSGRSPGKRLTGYAKS